MPAVVGFMVTATSGLPDAEQGMATGIAAMTQQVGITLGTPVMSAVAVTTATLPDGIARAVLVAALAPALLLRRSRRRADASRARPPPAATGRPTPRHGPACTGARGAW
ncbi:hypothetical protein ACFUT3_12500 [Streptomyces cinereoruber]|uniref:hypothetical protein n=1 Tax=Streptomyces cinereoruber TaxID=67260 RepID=UPI00362EFB83